MHVTFAQKAWQDKDRVQIFTVCVFSKPHDHMSYAFWLKLYVQISSQGHWRSEDSSISQGVLTMGTAGLRCWAHVHMSQQPRLNLWNGGQRFLPGLALWCPNTGSKCSKLEKWVKMEQVTLNRNIESFGKPVLQRRAWIKDQPPGGRFASLNTFGSPLAHSAYPPWRHICRKY